NMLSVLFCYRRQCISWDDYFMGVAFLAGQRSKDPVTQVGACIVNNENKIVGVGYNDMPSECDSLPWTKSEKKHYVCHAELNAIMNKTCCDLRNCTIYVSLHPCNECAKLIIQSGIKLVKYVSDKKNRKPKFVAARRMFETAGVECRYFTCLCLFLLNLYKCQNA
ncbi:Deoxycytidylate deaminase, partial [Habropoda laboriosa]